VSTSLASASSSAAAVASDLRQVAVGVGSQQPTPKKRKLFDFMSIPPPSAAEHTVTVGCFERLSASVVIGLDVLPAKEWGR